MTLRKYLVLLAIVFFGAAGDVLLSHGMRQVGEIHLANWHEAVTAVANPSITIGILFLIVYFAAYLSALSWADLTYVLPATAIGYVVIALMALYFLDERISMMRWAGIVLITIGVGFVAIGPSKTRDVLPESVAVTGELAGDTTPEGKA
ncbi:MAG TPA: EamA family transporter [Clostridia bacterium]|nr:EamA family transporter [Clostridia bacterium]